MDARAKLFSYRHIYDLAGTDALFAQAVAENAAHHEKGCAFYGRLLRESGVQLSALRSAADCAALPPLPAELFKRHRLLSVPKEALVLHATSSGTQGQVSQIDFDRGTLSAGLRMVLRCFAAQRLLSPLPTHYLMLGYQPTADNQMGAVRTAMGVTRFAPALRRVFFLRPRGDGYAPDLFGALDALARFARSPWPLRLVGFPSLLYVLLRAMEKQKLRYHFPAASRILLGGGWKLLGGEVLPKAALYALAQERLGIAPEQCRDFYSAVEHPVAYCECRSHRLHVPIYSRVVIRDASTLEPLGLDQPGLINFITPLVRSAPLTSVLMGDLAVLRQGCSCGCAAPYFEILGRAAPLRNCAVSATEWLGGTT